jgi:hypothetical protein
MLTLHNFSSRRQTVAVDPKSDNSGLLVDVFDEHHSRQNGTHDDARSHPSLVPGERDRQRVNGRPSEGAGGLLVKDDLGLICLPPRRPNRRDRARAAWGIVVLEEPRAICRAS